MSKDIILSEEDLERIYNLLFHDIQKILFSENPHDEINRLVRQYHNVTFRHCYINAMRPLMEKNFLLKDSPKNIFSHIMEREVIYLMLICAAIEKFPEAIMKFGNFSYNE